MIWNTKLENWKKGIVQKYPKNIKEPFFFETSPITKHMNEKYEEKFIQNKSLQFIQNYSSFEEHLIKCNKKYVISFDNLSKTANLIIPCPKKNKNFTTIKDFIDNASITQQKQF